MARTGEDIQETAHYRRPIVYILMKIFPKYARPNDPDAGIKQAERVPSLIADDRYDTSFAAEIVAAKYSYHPPIYRQEELFAGCGIQLPRSTLLNTLQAAARTFRPLAKYFRRIGAKRSLHRPRHTRVRLLLPKDVPRINREDPESSRVAEVIEKALAENRKSIVAKMWAYRGTSVPITGSTSR